MRLAHVGLGAFHRAHQAWYTQLANDLGAEQARIAAFTGRRPDAAVPLAAQNGRYTLVERGADGDATTDITAIDGAFDGADAAAWTQVWTDPELALVTLTITEKGYVGGSDGWSPDTSVGRLVAGLDARRRAGLGPVAIVSCDNLSGNGAHTARVVQAAATGLGDDLAAWVAESVAFPATMVDRITPATTEADLETVARLAGWADRAPVVAEPFSEWVLAGDFPAGRPAWEQVGATVVDDVEPYEHRKLWLLNGSHSLMAYLGLHRGHETVAQAIADPVCEAAVVQLWQEAAAVLPFEAAEIDTATDALRERYANARISHRLVQIASDGSQKLPPRIFSPHRLRAEAGLPFGTGAATALGAWVVHLTDGHAAERVNDPSAAGLLAELAGLSGTEDQVRAALRLLDDEAVDDPDVVGPVTDVVQTLRSETTVP